MSRGHRAEGIEQQRAKSIDKSILCSFSPRGCAAHRGEPVRAKGLKEEFKDKTN